MARLPRLVVPGQPHVVILRALDGRAAFADEADRVHFRAVLRDSLQAEQAQLHAYALGDDELRLLVTPANARSLARLMQAIGRRYVVAHNQRHGRKGTLWDGRFRACAIEPGDAVLMAMAWMERTDTGIWASSSGHHLGTQRDALITDPPAYWALGNTPFEREAAWRQRLQRGIDETQATRLQRAVLRGWPYGSPEFTEATAAATGRPAAPRPRGRPRRATGK